MRPRVLALAVSAVGAAACSDRGSQKPAPVGLVCAPGLEAFRGRCVEPARRYEPDERIDHDNVVAYGEPLTELALPEPPKSGFRLIVPPRELAPGEEWTGCVSWPIPDVQRRVVYAARLYTTPGLHHSNLIAKPENAELGPNPYPGCHPGASDPFADIGNSIPDVLFANSTQVVGEETLAFSAGMGFRLDVTREATTSLHLLNATAEPLRAEIAYDFFTMEESELTDEVAPFLMQVSEFFVPAHETETVGTSCKVFGGKIASLMPHTHQFARRFTVDLVSYSGEPTRVMDQGAYDLESDIVLYDPLLDLTDVDEIAFGCTFENTTDHDIEYGIGENEMCILFGYVTPPEHQVVGWADAETAPCKSVQLGAWH